MLLVYNIEGSGSEEKDPGQQATFVSRATRVQLCSLSRGIAEVVAAGRPRCPLCGEPMDSKDKPHGCGDRTVTTPDRWRGTRGVARDKRLLHPRGILPW